MAINPFMPKTVNAGEPVTAQGWNVIVNAIAALTDYLTTTEAKALQVSITNTGVDPSTTRVTAVKDDGVSFQAVAPVPPGTNYTFAGLKPGAYSIRVEALGFDPMTKSATVPDVSSLSVTLTPHGAFMPKVFGETLQATLTQLKNASIAVSRILDVAGRDVAPANPGSDYNDAPVLMQFPNPGEPVPPDGSAQLVVAASLKVQQSIELPSLAGLTLAEAQKALEGLGLVLGTVVTKTKA